jgi:hypothetical protein
VGEFIALKTVDGPLILSRREIRAAKPSGDRAQVRADGVWYGLDMSMEQLGSELGLHVYKCDDCGVQTLDSSSLRYFSGGSFCDRCVEGLE